METSGVSNEMLTLYAAQCRAHETVLDLQAQIEEEESVYLEETPHGNIIRGWDGFIDSKQPRKDANPKKIKPYTESEHLFSSCCLYSSMSSEPSYDQVDIYSTAHKKDDNTNRRKLTVTLSVGKGASAGESISGVIDSATLHNPSAVSKGSMVIPLQKANNTVTHLVTGKGAASLSYQNSNASALKKREREAEAAAAATARLHEAVSTNMPIIKSVAMSTPTRTITTATVAAQPPASDFLDVL